MDELNKARNEFLDELAAGGCSILTEAELRLREAVRLRVERLRSIYLKKVSQGMSWDAEVYSLMMDDLHMEKVVLNHMTKHAVTWSEVAVYKLTDGKPGENTIFVKDRIQRVKGEVSGLFYAKVEDRKVRDKVYTDLRIGHDPDDPRLFGVVEPKRIPGVRDEDPDMDAMLYGPSDARTAHDNLGLPEREVQYDTTVGSHAKVMSERQLVRLATMGKGEWSTVSYHGVLHMAKWVDGKLFAKVDKTYRVFSYTKGTLKLEVELTKENRLNPAYNGVRKVFHQAVLLWQHIKEQEAKRVVDTCLTYTC